MSKEEIIKLRSEAEKLSNWYLCEYINASTRGGKYLEKSAAALEEAFNRVNNKLPENERLVSPKKLSLNM